MRIAVPLVGLLTAGAALALVVFAPSVLFLEDTAIGPSASAPPASSEVAQVTAPPIRVRPATGKGATAGADETGTAGSPSSAGSQSGGLASGTAGKRGGSLARGGASGGEPALPPVETPGKTKSHGKAKHHGKAKGHAKHGKAKGHAKKHQAGRVAFTPPRGAKPGHVQHSRAQGHARGRARAHARPRC